MSDTDWVNELLLIYSVPKLDILQYLSETKFSVDTITISSDLHMQMSEVYQHLLILEDRGLVHLELLGPKRQEKRYWTLVRNFQLSLEAREGILSYNKKIDGSMDTSYLNKSTEIISQKKSFTRNWYELYVGVLLGITGNIFVESLMGLIHSIVGKIPTGIWILEIIVSGVFLGILLQIVRKYL